MIVLIRLALLAAIFGFFGILYIVNRDDLMRSPAAATHMRSER